MCAVYLQNCPEKADLGAAHDSGMLLCGLYKMLFYLEAVVHVLSLLRPPALSTLMRFYCTIIGQYKTPLPTSRLYALHHTILVVTISCKGPVGY